MTAPTFHQKYVISTRELWGLRAEVGFLRKTNVARSPLDLGEKCEESIKTDEITNPRLLRSAFATCARALLRTLADRTLP